MDSHMSKKRPLEEISSNISYSPPKRRSSFGFEMASIPTSTATISNEYHGSSVKESKLPKLSTTTSDASSATTTDASPLNDFQSRILSIQKRLSKKPPIITSTPFENNNNNNNNNSSVTSHPGLNELQDLLSSLNQECRDKHRKLEHLAEELSKLRRIHRNYQQKVEATTSEIDSVDAKLEYMEEEIVKYVANEEKLIEIKLNENQVKLDSQFNELEFEMRGEVQEVRDFDYSDLVEKIEELKQAEVKLNEEVRCLVVENDDKLNDEVDKLKQKFEMKEKEVSEQEVESRLKVDELQTELDVISERYKSKLSELEVLVRQVENLKLQIKTIEDTMNNYINVKRETELELSQIKQMLSEKQTQDKLAQKEFDTVEVEYTSLHDKIKKHDEHRRILENSIMDYQGKIRVYAIANDHEYNDIFNKCFQQDTPASFIIDEFSHFTKSITRGNNVGIVTQCLPGGSIILQTIKQLLQMQTQSTSWDLQFEYQAIMASNDICTDLLTGSTSFATSSLFSSQKMRIDEFDRVCNIINGFKVDKSGVIVHVITVNGIREMEKRRFQSRLVVIDLMNVDVDVQRDTLMKLIWSEKHVTTYLDRVLDWVRSLSYPLIVSKIDDSDTFNLLKTINSTSVACKKNKKLK
ncbi:hypothetical protein I9W82_000580 [Candida metapsilosis]|uniref:Spindle pole body-associated protein Vik1/Cik1 microtubule binding domain-containing protein n=1 Tax=Candida metapsilosis TaxID=273372 RepID=A0A8H8DD45_9ASCO|nr:hypothetical protein I9W82_000580 [Candida metapsilosis]